MVDASDHVGDIEPGPATAHRAGDRGITGGGQDGDRCRLDLVGHGLPKVEHG